MQYQNVTQIVTLHLHVSKTVITYDKNSKPVLKNHIMRGDQACKNSDQLDQDIAFHKALNVTYQISMRFIKKLTNKIPATSKS